MKKKDRATTKQQPDFPSYKKFIVVILTAFFAVFPLISYLKIMTLSGRTKELFPNNQGLSVDFFLYWKSVLLINLAVFLLLFFAGEFIFPDHRITHIPLFKKESRLPLTCAGIYALFAILSTIFSQNRSAAFGGIPTSCEGLWALLAYMAVFLAGLNYFGTAKAKCIFSTGLFFLIGLIALLALVEYLYKPIFELPLVSCLIAPSEYHEIAASLHSEGFTNQVALTFYNPDYFGGFCTLLFPITLSFILLSHGKIKKVASIILSILFFLALLLSRSSGATYAAIFTMILLLVLYRKRLKRWLPYFGIYACAAVVLFTTVHFLSGGRLLSSVIGNFTNTTTSQNTKEKFVLKDLSLDGNNLLLTGDKDILRIGAPSGKADLNALQFYDGDNEPVTSINNGDSMDFEDNRYAAIHIRIEEDTLVLDLGYKDTVEFYITPDGFKAIGQNGEALDSVPSLNPPFKNLYSLATGRGFTWVNSLPILQKCLFIGKGPDTFVFSFPQNDIVGLLNTHESAKFVIDKPHNFYLQTGINTGVPSLIALLVLFGCYLTRGIRRYWKDTADAFGIGIFAGVTAFLIIGLVNDSMVVVNPLFWLLLGVGYTSLQGKANAPVHS